MTPNDTPGLSEADRKAALEAFAKHYSLELNPFGRLDEMKLEKSCYGDEWLRWKKRLELIIKYKGAILASAKGTKP